MRPNQARDPARAARDRLLRLERQAKARAEAAAVAEGVAETVALSRARGQAVTGPEPGARGSRAQPYRRQSGLEWLAAKGRIDAAAKAAGERYGWAYRRAKAEQSIPSTLGDRLRGEFLAPDIAEVLAEGERTDLARKKLGEFRRRLFVQPDLVAACDLICGEEKTPREAAVGEREVAQLEALLKVALDILAARQGG
jgi:hypothetical protein